MGVILGEWVFPDRGAPALEAVIDGLKARTGLEIDCVHGDDGVLARTEIPLIKERLFGWDPQPDRISVHSFIPAHPYLWAQLNTVMTDLGGRIGDSPAAWRPDTSSPAFTRPWAELSGRQRLVLRLPTIGAWRPLDFLAEHDG